MNNKFLSIGLLSMMILVSAAANAATSFTAFSGTKADATQSVLNWANGRNVSITCSRPSMGPPWQCTGYISTTPSGKYYSVSAYGGTEAQTTDSAIAAWRQKANSTKTPYVNCKNPGMGPPWQCTASGRS
ncbi:MAG: hypothetical protein HRT53_15085 [Colwellia sp.]|nr:hypothetical protein [Colwellia sp.]